MKTYIDMKLVKDFTEDKFLVELAKANLVIFHGANDRNFSYEELKSFHERLLELNPDIEIHITEDVGHQVPPEWGMKIMEFFRCVGQV
ncbi:MAG: hypothetical protein GF411_20325 [Candidatus Lokiarchaeota archaeon]|nr:hypothetical protein [Candidatus Lokiarchaeota archaeon]